MPPDELRSNTLPNDVRRCVPAIASAPLRNACSGDVMSSCIGISLAAGVVKSSAAGRTRRGLMSTDGAAATGRGVAASGSRAARWVDNVSSRRSCASSCF